MGGLQRGPLRSRWCLAAPSKLCDGVGEEASMQSPRLWSVAIGFLASAVFALCSTAQAATLSASVFISGTLGVALWEIDISNSNAFALMSVLRGGAGRT